MNENRTIVPAGAAPGPETEATPYEMRRADEPPEWEPESAEEAADQGEKAKWQFWDGQIKSAATHENRWRAEALEAERLYFGPDNDPGKGGDQESAAKHNTIDDKTSMIHANIDVLKPLTYSETPQPVVRRRFYGDGKIDATALMAAEIGQRLADYILDTSDFDAAMFAARDDWLIAGRGASRALYKATFDTVQEMDPLTGQPLDIDKKVSEAVATRACEWARVFFAPASSWHAMPWLSFEVPMTRSQVEKRFGEDKARVMSFDQHGLKDAQRGLSDEDQDRGSSAMWADTESGKPAPSPFDTTTVHEIWCKEEGKVYWWAAGYTDGLLDEQDDPLGLEHFYPMPCPLLATVKGSSMTPRPDIKYYLRRAEEVEEASKKLRKILKALSVSGLVPGKDIADIKKLFNGENEIIPVADWIGLMEKGGSNDIVQWLPIDNMVKVAQALITMREQAKAAMFEASGVSDVMRATSDPGETATAQQIKGRYAGLRMSERQRQMAEYARDMLRILMEIALEHFDAQTIAMITDLDLPVTKAEREQIAMMAQMQQQKFERDMALHQTMQQAAEAGMLAQGVQLPPPPEAPPEIDVPETSFEEVQARLRTDFGRKITLSIETDSTVLADEQADKEARVEFLSAFAQFVAELAPMLQSGVFDMKLLKELLMFGVRGFPKSRTLESMIQDLPDEAPQGDDAPDPSVQVAQIRAEADRMLKEMDLGDKGEERKHEVKLKQMDIGGDLAGKAVDGYADASRPEPPEKPEPPQQKGE